MFSKKLCAQLLDGSLTDHGKYVSGVCRGFYVTVDSTANGMYVFRISAHSERDPGNAALREFAESRKTVTKQIQSVDVSAGSITIVSARTVLIKKVPAYLTEAIMPIIDYLVSNLYVSSCMECGTQSAPLHCYEINGSHHYLCDDCLGRVEGSLSQHQQEVLAKKSKLIPGLVGAFLGSLVGCLVYVLVWQLGYIAAIAGLITAVCAFKGYELLGGVVDRKGVLVCVVMIILAIFLANQLSWAYDFFSAFKDNGYDADFFQCFRSLSTLIREFDRLSPGANLSAQYYGYLALAYVMTVLGSFRSVVNAFKASSGSYTVKKMKE